MSLKFKPKSNNKFDTMELIPSADNYGQPSKMGKRSLPTFTEEGPSTGGSTLDGDINGKTSDLGNDIEQHDGDDIDNHDEDEHHPTGGTKFGTLDGVLGRCLLCMWGVIMFLRTGWIVGNAGIWQSTIVMLLSASITMFTTLSLSAICTNGEISHGGPYFLISRSLGLFTF